MMKVLTSAQIKALDHSTIVNEPIESIDLMERASRSFVTWFTERFNALKKIGIVCGTGNNGGDGLVIGRMLKEWGYPVRIWVVEGAVPRSEDFSRNFTRLTEQGVEPTIIDSPPAKDIFEGRDILIDAIFGTGLSRPVQGIYAVVIETMNEADAMVVAVDMPSGLQADKPSSGAIVKADFTLSFQTPKLCFFFPQYHVFTGQWILLDIGLHRDSLKKLESSQFFLTAKAIRRIVRKRKKFDHKGSFGHVLFVGGSYGKIGAVVLASRAIIRAGAGLLTVYAPRCGYPILQTAVPEAMVISDSADDVLSDAPDTKKYDAIGVGPGLGQSSQATRMLGSLLENASSPLVIDADALNILGTNREFLHLVPPGSILTPHPREFERLAGEWRHDFERLEKQKKLAADLKSVVVLKGAYTSIATAEGEVFFNSTGNPGMATGGTGDVLTGILTGLIAQGYSPAHAAILGVYLHGLSADVAVLEVGQESLIASDIVSFLPKAFRQVTRS